MSPVCDGCTNQTTDNKGGVTCKKVRYYEPNPGYGQFKGGAVCVYDSDLRNFFQPSTGEEPVIGSMSNTIARQGDEIQQLKYEKEQLEQRLLIAGP